MASGTSAVWDAREREWRFKVVCYREEYPCIYLPCPRPREPVALEQAKRKEGRAINGETNNSRLWLAVPPSCLMHISEVAEW